MDMDENLNLAHKMVDIGDRANKKIVSFFAVQYVQAREFLCSILFNCNKEGGREVSIICLFEFLT